MMLIYNPEDGAEAEIEYLGKTRVLQVNGLYEVPEDFGKRLLSTFGFLLEVPMREGVARAMNPPELNKETPEKAVEANTKKK